MSKKTRNDYPRISKRYANKILAIATNHTFEEALSILNIRKASLKRRCREILSDTGKKVMFQEKSSGNDTILGRSTFDERAGSLNIDGHVSSRHHNRVKILEDFLELHDVDMDDWEVDRVIYGASDVTMSGVKSSTNLDATYTNYNIKVFLKPKDKRFDDSAFIEQLEAIVKENQLPVEKIQYKQTEKENLLVLTINDLHLGRMSWADETEVNYDSKVAARYMREGLESLMSKAIGFGITKILYYVGHDFFTYDNAYPFASTTKGTPQEADSRWQLMFMRGEQLQIKAIRMLSQFAPVVVQEISGNHDKQASFYLGRVLAAVFEDDPNVTIDHSPKPREYFRFGNSLIGAAHGQKEKAIDLHAVMMAEARKDMGETKYWYFVMGHMHHFVEKRSRVLLSPTKSDRTLHGLKRYEEVDEDYKGLTITYLPNLAERDAYEVENSYVGTIRGAMAQVYSPTKGRIAVLQHNL